jgi:hypothetical protein
LLGFYKKRKPRLYDRERNGGKEREI